MPARSGRFEEGADTELLREGKEEKTPEPTGSPALTQATATEKLEQERRCAVIGVIVAPGLAHDVTSRIASELQEDLRDRYDSVDWRTELQVDRLVVPPASLPEIFAAGRHKLLAGD